MPRKNLLAWQYENYGKYHQNPVNLRIHYSTVPLFWAGVLTFAYGLIAFSLLTWVAGAALCFTALAAQGYGHSKEVNPSEPFLSRSDFVMRFISEQVVTFPRWAFFSKRKA